MKLVTIILDCGTITIDIRRLTTPYYNNLHEYKGVGFHRSFYFHLPTTTYSHLLFFIFIFLLAENEMRRREERGKRGKVLRTYLHKASKLVLYVEVQYIVTYLKTSTSTSRKL